MTMPFDNSLRTPEGTKSWPSPNAAKTPVRGLTNPILIGRAVAGVDLPSKMLGVVAATSDAAAEVRRKRRRAGSAGAFLNDAGDKSCFFIFRSLQEFS